MARKSTGKKLRFEVLKRDSFSCQYCGARAPDVLLHVDHIVPVVDGGKSDLMNLITSCQSCNGGKGARHLDDGSVVSKRHAQAAEMQARREQIEMMARWQHEMVDVEEQQTAAVLAYYARLVPGWIANDAGNAAIRSALSKYGLSDVMSGLRESAAKHVRIVDGKATEESVGIVWRVWQNGLRWKADRERDPVGSELRYIRGILRKTLSNCREAESLELMRRAHEAGVPMADIRSLAFAHQWWSQWERAVLGITAEYMARNNTQTSGAD